MTQEQKDKEHMIPGRKKVLHSLMNGKYKKKAITVLSEEIVDVLYAQWTKELQKDCEEMNNNIDKEIKIKFGNITRMNNELHQKLAQKNCQIDTMSKDLSVISAKWLLCIEELKQKDSKIKSLKHYNKLCMSKLKKLQKNNDKSQINLINEDKNKIIQMNEKYEILTGKYNALMIKERCTQLKLDELHDDHKQLEMDYSELKMEYNKIKKKKCHELWDTNDTIDWITSMENSRYEKYKDVLLKTMHEEIIDGACLRDLDKSDLHRLGIKDFKDKRDIYSAIQRLFVKQIAYQQQEGQNDTHLIV